MKKLYWKPVGFVTLMVLGIAFIWVFITMVAPITHGGGGVLPG